MNKYELTTERKRAAIIQAAQSLFGEKGVSDVSMIEIAKQADVSQASIYNYFGSKEAVVSECAKIVMEDTFSQANEILDMDMSYLEKINMALSLCTDGLNNSISQYFTDKALQDKTLVKLLVENLKDGKTKIYRQFIELGKKENCIDTDIPTEMYLSFMEAINTMGGDDISENLERNTEYIHKLFLYGLLGK